MSQFKDWNDFIKQLEDKKACSKELKKVKKCGSFETFFKHENIFDWLGWIFANCLDHPWPEAEPIILTNDWLSYRYARDVLKRPWPEAEPVILTNAVISYRYAMYVLKRPWPEAEPVILTDIWCSCCYVLDVLNRPWPEAEPIIMTDTEAWMYYSDWKDRLKNV